MKLKLEVTHVDPAKGELSFTPLGSELRGLLSYTGLPQRAIGRCHAGQTVEAEIPLPDFYPDEKRVAYTREVGGVMETVYYSDRYYSDRELADAKRDAVAVAETNRIGEEARRAKRSYNGEMIA